MNNSGFNNESFPIFSCLLSLQDLTYRIVSFSNDTIPPETQRQIFHTALDLWQSASTLRFTEVQSSVTDILISYVTRNHSDGSPFDGPGRTLAHAFFPSNNQGEVHSKGERMGKKQKTNEFKGEQVFQEHLKFAAVERLFLSQIEHFLREACGNFALIFLQDNIVRTQQFVEIEDMSLFITWVWGGEFWGILWFSVGTEGGQSSLNDC